MPLQSYRIISQSILPLNLQILLGQSFGGFLQLDRCALKGWAQGERGGRGMWGMGAAGVPLTWLHHPHSGGRGGWFPALPVPRAGPGTPPSATDGRAEEWIQMD